MNENLKITNVKLIDGDGKVEVEVTKTVVEKHVLEGKDLIRILEPTKFANEVKQSDSVKSDKDVRINISSRPFTLEEFNKTLQRAKVTCMR